MVSARTRLSFGSAKAAKLATATPWTNRRPVSVKLSSVFSVRISTLINPITYLFLAVTLKDSSDYAYAADRP